MLLVTVGCAGRHSLRRGERIRPKQSAKYLQPYGGEGVRLQCRRGRGDMAAAVQGAQSKLQGSSRWRRI